MVSSSKSSTSESKKLRECNNRCKMSSELRVTIMENLCYIFPPSHAETFPQSNLSSSNFQVIKWRVCLFARGNWYPKDSGKQQNIFIHLHKEIVFDVCKNEKQNRSVGLILITINQSASKLFNSAKISGCWPNEVRNKSASRGRKF